MNSLPQTSTYPGATFWDRIAKRYARKPVADQPAYEAKLAKTDGYLKPGNKVLEIGCGTGTTAIHHAPTVEHIRAIDISGKMIEIARAKAQDAKVNNIDFEVNSIEQLALEPESFDTILAHSILHLLPNVEDTLVQLHRALKPGGLLISSVICMDDVVPVFRYIAPIGRVLRILPLLNTFSETQLERWLAAAGLVVEERWQPKPKAALYIVARKPEATGGS